MHMDMEQHLNQIAEHYRAQGYKVVVRPGPVDLPSFAKDFKVEILAHRGDGAVLASAKKNQSALEEDQELPRYAEIIGKEPGWRFDLMVLESEIPPMPARKVAKEPSEEDIHRALGEIERLLPGGFVQQAFIAACAVLEATMRRWLQANGEKAGWGSSPQTMLSELYSSGPLESKDFRDLERLFHARSAIVHGLRCRPSRTMTCSSLSRLLGCSWKNREL